MQSERQSREHAATSKLLGSTKLHEKRSEKDMFPVNGTQYTPFASRRVWLVWLHGVEIDKQSPGAGVVVGSKVVVEEVGATVVVGATAVVGPTVVVGATVVVVRATVVVGTTVVVVTVVVGATVVVVGATVVEFADVVVLVMHGANTH
jgi:NDP-sugar pyrophosphorylase family protein